MPRRKPKRKTTATRILEYLAGHEPSSRPEICRGLDLTESTVRRAIARDLNLHTERRITDEGPFEYVHSRRLAPPNPYRVSTNEEFTNDGTSCDAAATSGSGPDDCGNDG